MPWTIERKHDHVAVVTMNTNKVNAQNPAFFGDLHAAFDRLEAEFEREEDGQFVGLLVKNLEKKPFALIGVNVNRYDAKSSSP